MAAMLATHQGVVPGKVQRGQDFSSRVPFLWMMILQSWWPSEAGTELAFVSSGC